MKIKLSEAIAAIEKKTGKKVILESADEKILEFSKEIPLQDKKWICPEFAKNDSECKKTFQALLENPKDKNGNLESDYSNAVSSLIKKILKPIKFEVLKTSYILYGPKEYSLDLTFKGTKEQAKEAYKKLGYK